MAVLALKIAGAKNGVSKLHGDVSKELFSELWPNTAVEEIPFTYVTNGDHTCTWLAPTLKELYNAYMRPFWQENAYDLEYGARPIKRFINHTVENLIAGAIINDEVKPNTKIIIDLELSFM
jgi:glucan phosphorylase